MNTTQRIGGYTVTTSKFPWWVPLTVGILVVAAAIGLMAWPWAPVNLLVLIFGAGLIANGLAILVFNAPKAGTILMGVLLVLGGILSFVFYDFVSTTLVWVVGFAVLLVGVFWLINGLRFEGDGKFFVIVPAVLTLLAGVVTLIWPTFVLTVVAVIVGVFTLVLGIAMIWNAFRLRKNTVTVISR